MVDAALAAKPKAPTAEGKEPPFGSSSASQVTPNAGYEAAAMQAIGPLIGQVQRIMTMVGAASETGKVLLKVLNDLVKLVPAGSVTPPAEKNMIEQMSMKNTQNNSQMQALQQQRQGGIAPGGASAAPMPGAPPGGAPQPQGMPRAA